MSCECDVLLLGGGLAAGAFLRRLYDQGFQGRVVVVDAGKTWAHASPSPPSMEQLRETRDVQDDPILLASGEGPELPACKWWAPRHAGGGSLLWYGQLHRFDEQDMHPSSCETVCELQDHELRDWPVSSSELQPYYEEVVRVLTPFTADPRLAAQWPGTRVKPRLSGLEGVIFNALEQEPQLRVARGLSCLGGVAWDQQPVDPMLPAVAPAEHALQVRPNFHTLTMVRAALDSRVTVLQGCRATKLLHKRGRATGARVRYPDGLEAVLRAPVVILACGAIESTRLVLDADVPGAQAVGHGFTFTNEFNRYVVTKLPRDASDLEDRLASCASLSVTSRIDSCAIRRGKLAIYDAVAFEGPRKAFSHAAVSENERQELLRRSAPEFTLKLSFKGASIPWRGKRVRLSAQRCAQGLPSVRLEYVQHPADVQILEEGERLVAKVVRELGGALLPHRRSQDVTSAHQHGGLRFGEDSSQCVLDARCEAHGCRGLFVADGSFMPTSGHVNASWTVMANAMRVADIVQAR